VLKITPAVNRRLQQPVKPTVRELKKAAREHSRQRETSQRVKIKTEQENRLAERSNFTTAQKD
jgi:hypothetical protein